MHVIHAHSVFSLQAGIRVKLRGESVIQPQIGMGGAFWAFSQGMDKSTFVKDRVMTHDMYNTDHDSFVLQSSKDGKKRQSCKC